MKAKKRTNQGNTIAPLSDEAKKILSRWVFNLNKE